MIKFTTPVVPPSNWAGVWKNTWLGCLAGLMGGLLLTLIVGERDMFRGRFVHYGVAFPMIALTYVGGGAAAGATAGLLSPLTRWYIGTLFLSGIAMSPFYFGVQIAMHGPITHWDSGDWVGAILLPFLVGSVAGHTWWMSRDHPPPRRSSSGDLPSPRRKFRPWKS
jgi:hypothetical protein